MITLHSFGRMRSPDMITRMLRNTSNKACEHTEEMSYHNLILKTKLYADSAVISSSVIRQYERSGMKIILGRIRISYHVKVEELD